MSNLLLYLRDDRLIHITSDPILRMYIHPGVSYSILDEHAEETPGVFHILVCIIHHDDDSRSLLGEQCKIIKKTESFT